MLAYPKNSQMAAQIPAQAPRAGFYSPQEHKLAGKPTNWGIVHMHMMSHPNLD